MFKRFAALTAVVLVFSLAIAQETQTEWTIEKVSSNLGKDLSSIFPGHGGGQGGIAKWPIKDQAVEQVWKAVMQTLVFMKGIAAEGNLDSGTITAKRAGTLIRFVITPSDTGADLFGRWEFVSGEKWQFSTPFNQAKKFFNDLFPKVKEALK